MAAFIARLVCLLYLLRSIRTDGDTVNAILKGELDGDCDGTQCRESVQNDQEEVSVKQWMQRNGIDLLDETYDKLQNHGFETIADLTMRSAETMMQTLEQKLNIKTRDGLKLEKALNILGSKRIIVGPEELEILQSMEMQIDALEKEINGLKLRNKNVEKAKIKIQDDIKSKFESLRDLLNKREFQVLKELNQIVSEKQNTLETGMRNCAEIRDSAKKIKQATGILVDVPITMNELNARKQKVVQHEQEMNTIIHDHKNDAHQKLLAIPDEISLLLNTSHIMEVINDLGHVFSTFPMMEDSVIIDEQERTILMGIGN